MTTPIGPDILSPESERRTGHRPLVAASSAPELTIVIPALNERGAIASTIERCLAARDEICRVGGLSGVQIIVVSDGSTDGTDDLARQYDEITVLVFRVNRGYGAAIQCGFAHGRGELVGFLDADGTCDPRVFGALCRAIHEGADIALGSRLGKGNDMPALRVLGNRLFALLLGILSKRGVGDTASGMRVLRREALRNLLPLPDGLHFTPAMSARALIEGQLRLIEVPMPYAERVGRSKLSVVRDGLRFLEVILATAMCYRPARPMIIVAAFLAVTGVALFASPLLLYAQQSRLEEWMIYRLLLGSLFVFSSAQLTAGAAVAERIAAFATGRDDTRSGITGWLLRSLSVGRTLLFCGLALGVAVVVTWPGIRQWVETRHVDMHWSRAMLASLLAGSALTLALTTLLFRLLDLLRAQRLRPELLPPDEIYLPTGENDR